MESKKNVATKLLESLGVFNLMQQRLTVNAPKKVAKKKIYLTDGQKKRIAGLRSEQNYKESELKRLKRITKGKIKTINNLPKREVFNLFENDIKTIKGTITSLRG